MIKLAKGFTIIAPNGSAYISLAVGIVHNTEAGWATLGMLIVYGTIVENWLSD